MAKKETLLLEDPDGNKILKFKDSLRAAIQKRENQISRLQEEIEVLKTIENRHKNLPERRP